MRCDADVRCASNLPGSMCVSTQKALGQLCARLLSERASVAAMTASAALANMGSVYTRQDAMRQKEARPNEVGTAADRLGPADKHGA